jgi:transcription elongation factor Elf1
MEALDCHLAKKTKNVQKKLQKDFFCPTMNPTASVANTGL